MSSKQNFTSNQVSQNSITKSRQKTNKAKSFQSSHNNRLGGLIYHPDLIEEHKEILEGKMSLVNFTRKVVEYGGCGIFLLHILRNRLRIRKFTGLYIAIPPALSYIIKVCGYFWVDNYAERSGLYKMYRISTF